MSRYEKIGSFLLFDKVGEDLFSSDFLAGQITNYQVQNIFVLKKLDPALLKFPDLIPELTADYETVKTLANPNIIRPYVLVAEKNDFAAVFDHVEGKSLRAVLNKCSQDNFPFSVDHSLLVGSRLCTALEYLHSKKVDEERLIHGFVCPESIFVTYDGEIKLQYFGLARILMKIPETQEKFLNGYRSYIAPELKETVHWDKAVDIYGAGTVLYEMLTGEPLNADVKKGTLAGILQTAEISSNSGEKIPMSEDLKKVLMRSLSPDPAQRYPSIADMRKALDLLLFSSEFSPTTFHLAFFMNSLFRESIDAEAKSLASLRKLDARNFIKDEGATASGAQPTLVIERPSSVPSVAAGFSKSHSASAQPVLASADSMQQPPTRPEMAGVSTVKEKSRVPLFIGILLVLALVGTLAYVFLFLKPQDATRIAERASSLPLPAVQVPPPQQQVEDQEKQKLKQEAEKAKEEALRKDEQLKSLLAELEKIKKAQAEASKKKENVEAGQVVDTIAIQKLEEEAKRLRQEKKQQQALAEQKLKEAQATVTPPVEEAKLQESSPASEEQKVVSAGDVPVPAPGGQEEPTPGVVEKEKPAPEVPAVPAVNEGDLVELSPDVTKPAIVNRVEPAYPRRAMQKKAEGTVILRILISEKGEPSEVNVLRDPGGSTGFKEAAVTAVKKWKFRPAVKDGKRVKVWMTYPIVFKFQGQ